MRHGLFTAAFVLLTLAAVAAPPPQQRVMAKTAVLMDPVTRQVLWSRNADLRRPPASTTKVMTALLVLEHGGLDDMVVISERAATSPHGCLTMTPGEQISLHDLLVALMLQSSNDACIAVAEHVAGSVEAFVSRMNERARELGCRNTQFRNPNGLHEPGHYSSARDLAVIAVECLRLPEFRRIMAMQTARIKRSSGSTNVVMINRARTYMQRTPGADGIKTGYTKQAGHCFIGSAVRDGRRLITVSLNSPQVFNDTQMLLKLGFTEFTRTTLVQANEVVGEVTPEGRGARPIPVITEQVLAVAHPKSAPAPRPELKCVIDRPQLPVRRGQPVGRLEARLNGKLLTSAPVILQKGQALAPPPSWPRWLRPLGVIAGSLLLIVAGFGLVRLLIGLRGRSSRDASPLDHATPAQEAEASARTPRGQRPIRRYTR